jgi:hypothetical protein
VKLHAPLTLLVTTPMFVHVTRFVEARMVKGISGIAFEPVNVHELVA